MSDQRTNQEEPVGDQQTDPWGSIGARTATFGFASGVIFALGVILSMPHH